MVQAASPFATPGRWYNQAREKSVMQPDVLSSSALALQLVQLRIDSTGQFTAQVPGIPELSFTAPTRAQAVEQLRRVVVEWLSSGRLVSLQVPTPTAPLKPPGWAKDDPL